MKINEGFVLRQVAGTWVVVAVGKASVDFDKMLTFNDSGALLWNAMADGASTREDLVCALTNQYDVSPQQAGEDIDEFLNTLRQAGCISD